MTLPVRSGIEPNQLGRKTDPAAVDYYASMFLLFTAFLLLSGLAMLYSTSGLTRGAHYFWLQLVWAVLGSLVAYGLYRIGYRALAKRSLWWIVGVVILLGMALLFKPINGAQRWIKIGIGSFSASIQPSEFAKVALAIFVADYVSGNLLSFNQIFRRRGLLPLITLVAVVLGMILLGRDLGTTVLCAGMVAAMLIAAGLGLRYLLVPVLALVGGTVFIWFYDSMRLSRILGFLHPEQYKDGIAYQLWMSLLAIGSGGFRGRGLSSSRMKALYLPEAHTDFIMSIIGEELGFAGLTVLLGLYVGFCYYALRIAVNAGSKLGSLLVFGLTAYIGMQTAINIMVVTGMMPTKGMPAPFVSYGGSNMLACMTAVGIILSVAHDSSHPGYYQKNNYKLKAFLGKIPLVGRIFK